MAIKFEPCLITNYLIPLLKEKALVQSNLRNWVTQSMGGCAMYRDEKEGNFVGKCAVYPGLNQARGCSNVINGGMRMHEQFIRSKLPAFYQKVPSETLNYLPGLIEGISI